MSNTEVVKYYMNRGNGIESFVQVVTTNGKNVSRIDIGHGYVDEGLFLDSLRRATEERLPAAIVSLIYSYVDTETEDSILLQLGYEMFTRTALLVPYIFESVAKSEEPFINGKDVTRFAKEWPSLDEISFYRG
jgi:hypothetical protein